MHAHAAHTQSPTQAPSHWRLVHATDDAEVFVAPSAEAKRAFVRTPALFAPGSSDRLRPLRDLLVAPYAHLIPTDVQMQLYLVDVFHTRRFTFAAHVVGTWLVNATLAAVCVEALGAWAGVLYTATLVSWAVYLGRRTELALWSALGAVQALTAGLLGAWFSVELGWNGLFLAWLASAWLVACGHLIEPLPPRSGDPLRWTPIPEFLFGAPGARHRPATVGMRVLRLTPGPFVGLFNETLASPRIMSFFLLRVLTMWGYGGELVARHDGWRDRALASGNPALDYIGIGGGSTLELTSEA